MTQLKNDDLFPDLEAPSLGHGTVRLPRDIPAGAYAVILVYRAHW
jgi:hypothetical protein